MKKSISVFLGILIALALVFFYNPKTSQAQASTGICRCHVDSDNRCYVGHGISLRKRCDCSNSYCNGDSRNDNISPNSGDESEKATLDGGK